MKKTYIVQIRTDTFPFGLVVYIADPNRPIATVPTCKCDHVFDWVRKTPFIRIVQDANKKLRMENYD